MEKTLPAVELSILKTLLRLFEYKEYSDRGIKKLSSGFSNTTVDSFDSEYINFNLNIGVRDGSKVTPPTEHYRIKRSVLLEDTSNDEKMLQIECMDIEIVSQEPYNPKDMLMKFKVEQGAIVLPEGMRGRQVKGVNRMFHLRILKKKRHRTTKVQVQEVHDRMLHSITMDKARAGKLKLINRRLKN